MHCVLDLSELTTLIGRLFMAGMPGPVLDQGTRDLIRLHGLGGVILFARNIEDPLQVATLCRDLQEASLQHQQLPLFIAVDQEGGPVARLKDPFTRFPGNTVMGKEPDALEKAADFGRVTARELALVGITMNMAPVLDVPVGEPEKHLAGRTFSQDPHKVNVLGQVVIQALQENGVMAVAKHFPGLGRAARDPHHELPLIQADKAEMDTLHLHPFQGAVGVGVSSVMTSHAVYPALDPDHPATLSYRILSDLLRGQMGFQGLIITDDLEMGAIGKTWGAAEGAVKAFEAGCDILLICRDQEEVIHAMERLKARLIREERLARRLRRSNERLATARATYLSRAPKVSLKQVRDYFKRV